MKTAITYPTYVHDLVEGVSKNVHDLTEALCERGMDAVDASPRVDVSALNRKSVYLTQGLAAMERVREAMDDPDTDVVHYHVTIPLMSAWGALAKSRARRSKPMVLHLWNPWYDVRDTHVRARRDRIYHRLFNGPLVSMPFLPAYDALVVSSEYQRRQLQERGVKRDIHVVPNGVDLQRYVPAPSPTTRRNARRELGIPTDGTLLCYYGHLTPWKGARVLAEALPGALRANPDARVVIAHTAYGTEARSLRERLHAARLMDRVHFLGVCDVPLLLQAADIGVVPATAAVGTACHPNVVLEYAAAGVPIVASRVGSIPEAVDDGVTGLLATPGDAVDLARQLDRLLSDPDLRRRLGDNARRRAEHDFDWQAIAQRYEKILEGVA